MYLMLRYSLFKFIICNNVNHLLQFYVFFVDERNVPHSSPDSNRKGAQDALLSKVAIPQSQVYGIQEGVSVREAAVNYEGRLIGLPTSVLPRNDKGFPIFDLVLLGVGES